MSMSNAERQARHRARREQEQADLNLCRGFAISCYAAALSEGDQRAHHLNQARAIADRMSADFAESLFADLTRTMESPS